VEGKMPLNEPKNTRSAATSAEGSLLLE